jgi:hypothetical protein
LLSGPGASTNEMNAQQLIAVCVKVCPRQRRVAQLG